jgi:CheY-like chemotaxis protein/HPt (histidine-containing phosphotransfer) domain-containing protein
VPLDGKRVLVVDDLALSRQIYRSRFEGWGLTVMEAEDGFTALAMVGRARAAHISFDLILVDQDMPGMLGEEFVDRLREQPDLFRGRIILASSAGLRAKVEGERPQADAALIKPIKARALFDCVQDLLAGKTPFRAEARAAAGVDERPPASDRRQILLVEDNLVNQKVARAMLERAGHRVAVAAHGAEAVARVEAESYDIILMDIQMPVMDGLEATRLIRGRSDAKAQLPIVAMTANAMQGAREEYLAAGMDGYLSKPIDARTMLDLVDHLGGVQRPALPPPIQATKPASASEVPAIDEPQFDSIRQVLAPHDFNELINAFLEGAADRLARIEHLADAGEFDAVCREAHDMVSTAGNFGARRVESAARQLEAACRNRDRPAAEAAATTLRREADTAFRLMRQLLPSVPA